MITACAGATTVYQCAMPPLDRWRVDFPVLTDVIIEATARLVFADDTWITGESTVR